MAGLPKRGTGKKEEKKEVVRTVPMEQEIDLGDHDYMLRLFFGQSALQKKRQKYIFFIKKVK